MKFFWVNIGTSYKEVLDGDFLWAPISSNNAKGTEIHRAHWDNVANVRTGDIIFCCYKKHINFIAQASEDAKLADRPTSRSFDEWGKKGNQVNVTITHLHCPVSRDDISAAFIKRFNQYCIPTVFTNKGTLSQIYMAQLPADAGLFLLEAAQQIGLAENALIDEGNLNGKVSETTRAALIQARVGQGKFRSDLMKRWNHRCSLTGIENIDLLIASHIVAWAKCDNKARLDPDNGLLLASHVDRLFDRGWISFADDGELLVDKDLSAADRKILAIEQFPRLKKLTNGNRHYLAKHRSHFHFE